MFRNERRECLGTEYPPAPSYDAISVPHSYQPQFLEFSLIAILKFPGSKAASDLIARQFAICSGQTLQGMRK
jgi:hypothetical protein